MAFMSACIFVPDQYFVSSTARQFIENFSQLLGYLCIVIKKNSLFLGLSQAFEKINNT
jgi:hypothetical protein